MAGANELAGHVRWMAKEVHRAYHQEEAALWTECERATCRETCKILEMPVTMPGVEANGKADDEDKKIRILTDSPCSDCGGKVYRTSKRGRTPVRCEKCRGVKV